MAAVNKERRRVLIIAFDALRPDMVTPQLMPHLSAFAKRGVHFSHSRSTFPTETRVNQTALVTGCYPEKHGIVGNKFLDAIAAPGQLFDTGDETQLSEGNRRLQGRLVGVSVLGELLAAEGMSLAVSSAGTPGGTRMLHHKAEEVGGFRLSLHRPDASVPAERIQALLDRLGPIPKHEIPSLSWLSYVTDAYLEYIEPELSPNVCVLWYCEPDNSYHYRGIGSDANLDAIRQVDSEFGRILAWRAGAKAGEQLQVVTLSDHGQLTAVGEALDLSNRLSRAGFSVGETVDDGADVALALDSAGGIYVRDSDPRLILDIVDWLQGRPWCGPVFTRAGRTALTHSHVGITHRRAPDIGLVLRSDDAMNGQGLSGTCSHDSHYPANGGVHGGLHPMELRNWFAANGNAFRSDHESKLPTGIVDVLPTVLHLLGIDVPSSVQGRVLYEALEDHLHDPLPQASESTFTAKGKHDYCAHLTVSQVGETRYLERGWVD